MKVFYNDSYSKHKTYLSSFENKDRIEYVLKRIDKKICIKNTGYDESILRYISLDNLIDIQTIYDILDFWNCETCSFQNRLEDKICQMCNVFNDNTLKQISKIDGDTTVCSRDTCLALLQNINTICSAIDYQSKNVEDVFLLIRPPGHHSNCGSDECKIDMQGFCLINNLSYGVKYLQNKYRLKKIAIVDWDVHHGNGTQKIYYGDDSVLFIDLHQYDGIFYPKSGKEDEKGEGKGEGYTINIPLDKGSDERIYLEKFEKTVIPSLQKFDPEWIMISCGFDAHKDDPLGGMKLSSESFKKFYDLLKTIKNVNFTLFLEGGYNSKVICDCVSKLVSAS